MCSTQHRNKVSSGLEEIKFECWYNLGSFFFPHVLLVCFETRPQSLPWAGLEFTCCGNLPILASWVLGNRLKAQHLTYSSVDRTFLVPWHYAGIWILIKDNPNLNKKPLRKIKQRECKKSKCESRETGVRWDKHRLGKASATTRA